MNKNLTYSMIVALVVSLVVGWLVLPNLSVDKPTYGGQTHLSGLYVEEEGLTVTGATTLSATTTIAKSPDGFVLWDDFTVSTTTPVRGALTNSGSALMCDGDSLAVYFDSTGFSPSVMFAVGTTTSSTAYAASLMGSTTVATTTDTVQGIASGWPFLLPSGSSVTLAVGDIANAEASSTYYGNWSGQISVHCWTLGQ